MSETRAAFRYLGTAGWHFFLPGLSLMIDPYFTRAPLRQVALGRLYPDLGQIQRYCLPMDALIVTHAHYDHIADIPAIAMLYPEAKLYSDAQSADLLALLGVDRGRIEVVQDGSAIQLGDCKVEFFSTPHRRIAGRMPYRSPLRKGLRPPLRASDYHMGLMFSLRLSINYGPRVLITSGIDAEPEVKADYLLVGPDAPEAKLRHILAGSQPRVVIPNHFDDFFRLLDAPFVPIRNPALPLWRVDVEGFPARVRALRPEAEVIIPQRLVQWIPLT